MANTPSDRNNMTPPVVEMDYFYGCLRVNGILFPEPISCVPLTPPPPPPPPPPPSSQQVVREERQEQPQPVIEGPHRKKRDLTASRVIETRTFTLQLFRCEENDEYILAMHEVVTGKTTFYLLLPYEKLGRKKMEAKEIFLGQRVVFPVTEEVYPDVETKYKLSLKERLEGRWTVEVRERTGTTKTEKV